MSLSVLLGGLALVLPLILQFRCHWYVFQYLFLLRFPIVLATLFFLSPFAACEVRC